MHQVTNFNYQPDYVTTHFIEAALNFKR